MPRSGWIQGARQRRTAEVGLDQHHRCVVASERCRKLRATVDLPSERVNR